MFSYVSQLEIEAKKAAIEFTVNEEKQKCFIQGAQWAVQKLVSITDVHPMEEMAGATQLCDRLRLKDVRKFVDEMLKSIKLNPTNKPDKARDGEK